ncbi:Alpha amylase, partial [Operophtera brumata]
GEELGMTDGQVSWEDTKDPQACNTDDPVNYWTKSRDPTRTPYHWDASANAGFSTNASTWLPVADNYLTVNLAAQMAATNSHYK